MTKLDTYIFFREPDDETEESEIAKVERVYVGVACLLQRFPRGEARLEEGSASISDVVEQGAS